jgi:hypothetical protein
VIRPGFPVIILNEMGIKTKLPSNMCEVFISFKKRAIPFSAVFKKTDLGMPAFGNTVIPK